MVDPRGETFRAEEVPNSESEFRLPTSSIARKRLGPGLTVAHYELIRPLGKGGMGEVYLARDTRLGRRVAVKFLLEHTGPAADRFLVEARITAQCRHENIVVIYDVGECDGVPYIVLEYIDGRSLRDAMAERGEGMSVMALDIMIAVARALDCAHAMGIVHRDLKPENILLSDLGQVKVVDFGIAKQVSSSMAATLPGQGSQVESMSMTQDGMLVGTMPYMAPEQWTGEGIDARTDIWAAGIILFELVTGKHPLEPVTYARLSQVVDLNTPMPSMRDKCPEGGAFADVIDRCLKKHVDERWASAKELAAALERLATEKRGVLARDQDEIPFNGLAAFQKSDAARFFGRDYDIAAALGKLRSSQLLVIAGPSGAGKSSFVRAGILPALERNGREIEAFVLRPGRRPLAALADVFAFFQERGSATSDEMDPETIAATLRSQPGRLGARLRSRCRTRGDDHRIILFVDQLEELYTLGIDSAERAAFCACLEGVADDASSPLRVIMTIRADYLDRVAEDRQFWREVSRGLLFLPPMTREGLRDAFVKPLELVGYRFEDEALVTEMLDGLEGTTTPLPILQFTATKTWEKRDHERRLLTRSAYQSLGGVAGAMSTHADAVLASLSLPEQRLAKNMFMTLVTPERTRAIVPLDELTSLALDAAAVEHVVQQLADARLLAIDTKGEREGKTVELIHESLIERWPLLNQWLEQEKGDAQFRTRVRTAAKEWETSGRPEGLLWRGESAEEGRRYWTLHTGQGTTDLSAREVQFLEAVVLLGDRERHRRRRIVAMVMASMGFVVVVVSILAVRANREAMRANEQATRANQEAIQTENARIESDRSAARARNATRMAVAREHQDDATMVLALLREIEPGSTPRGWADLVMAARNAGVARTVLLHDDLVQGATFSPDGKRIAVACYDRMVRIWNADGSGQPTILRGHEAPVWSAAFSPDGKHVVSASLDKTVRVWNADGSGQPVVLRGHEAEVYDAAFSPDGKRIGSGSRDKTVRVWNADGTANAVVLRGHEENVFAVAFLPDGKQLVSASVDKTMRKWNADGSGGSEVFRGHEGSVFTVAVSADGKHIATASRDKTVRVWNTSGTGAPVVLRGHEGEVYGVAFSPDGQRIATVSQDRTVRLWNVDGSGTAQIIRGHNGNANRVAFSPDGKRLVSASYDKSVRVWNVDDVDRRHIFSPTGGGVFAAGFSSDGKSFASAVNDGTVAVWNANGTGQPIVFRGHEGPALSVAWSPDDTRIASTGNDRTIRIWNIDGHGEPIVLRGHQDIVQTVRWSHDGQRIVSASDDETARVWNADGRGEPVVFRGHDRPLGFAAFSGDDRRIISASADRTVRVWNSDGSGQPLVIRHNAFVSAAAFSPDGQHIISTSYDRLVRIWNADGNGEPLLLRGHEDTPLLLGEKAFSPDGKRFVTSSIGGTLRIWNTDGSGEPLTLRISKEVVNTASFSPDGRRIIAASMDGTITVWSSLESLSGPDDPHLWSATTYCIPLDVRQRLLDFSEAQSRADLERCQKKVSQSLE